MWHSHVPRVLCHCENMSVYFKKWWENREQLQSPHKLSVLLSKRSHQLRVLILCLTCWSCRLRNVIWKSMPCILENVVSMNKGVSFHVTRCSHGHDAVVPRSTFVDFVRMPTIRVLLTLVSTDQRFLKKLKICALRVCRPGKTRSSKSNQDSNLVYL